MPHPDPEWTAFADEQENEDDARDRHIDAQGEYEYAMDQKHDAKRDEKHLRERLRAELYWNEVGEVLCGLHIPSRLSDTWKVERWQRVPWADLKTVRATDVACEACRKGGES